MTRVPAPRMVVFLWLVLAAAAHATPQHGETRPRVLLTNDDGIDDRGLVALAETLARSHDVYVVAPATNQSGAGSSITAVQRGELRASPRQLDSRGDHGIRAWAVEGTPGDCVLLATSGLLDPPPDVVVSGINGGANLADEWIASGTIGAARVAAYLGLPAFAVSGVDDDDPVALAAATEWVTRLLEAGVAQSLPRGVYVTISLPERVAPGSDVVVVQRARGAARIELAASPTDAELWRVTLRPTAAAAGTDVAAWAAGKVAVVPMRVGEEIDDAAGVLDGITWPEWPPPNTAERVDGRR